MKTSKLILLLAIIILASLFFVFDLGQYLSLDYLKSQQQQLDSWYQNNPGLLIGSYFIIYIAVTGLSLPGAALSHRSTVLNSVYN